MDDTLYYVIGGTDFELYQAASGDYCVGVSEYGKETEYYNIGTSEAAKDFILSYAEVK